MPSRSWPSGPPIAASCARRFKSIQDLERLIARIALSTAGPRDLLALGRSLGAVPRLAMVLADCQAPLVRSLVGELDDLPDVRQWIEAAIQDDPPALARDGGFVRDGLDQDIDELRHISRSGKQVIAEMEDGERARTGIALAQGPLQPRLRLLHRDLEVEPARGAGRLHPQADHRRRRALHHAGAEGLRREGARRRRAHRRRASSRSSRRCASGCRRRRRACSTPRARWPALDVLGGLAETATACNYTKPHVHDGDEIVAVDVRHPVVERLAGGKFVPNDIHLDGATPSARDPDRPEHGRQVNLPAAGRASLRARADRIVRAGARGQDRVDRSALRAGRRVRQHRARPIHLHGGDAGDRRTS